jgi:REase_DpnII-MboI
MRRHRAAMTDEHDHTSLWLTAIEALIQEARTGHPPSVGDVVGVLRNVQSALKRWPWKERSRRGAMPSRWLIDDEADVQALLWAILAPVYGPDLVDEQYLPHWGQVQPRCDLGIVSLKLIIEVKILRTPADFRAVEEQVAGDTGLYFREPGRFDRMVVVVYDDSDRPQPERYATLAAALKLRERIAEVVILRRPSMIPDRNART